MTLISKLFYLFIGVLFTLVLTNLKWIVSFSNNNSGFVTLLSVLIVILTFLLTYLFEHTKQVRNQESILRTLKFKIREIEDMVKSYNEVAIPFYALPILDDDFYLKNLDYNYNGKETSDLKFCINRIKDKCLIINLMIDKIRNSLDTFLVSNNIDKKDRDKGEEINKLLERYPREDKVFKFYYPKFKAIIKDNSDKKGLLISLSKSLSILTERFNIT